MDVHLRDLRYFLTVAEHLNFTRAAEELFISQPALSKQIRALESQLRVQLFEREHRSVTLTRAGEALRDELGAVLLAWETVQEQLARASIDEQTTILVGISTGLGRGLLPAVRTRLQQDAPLAKLQIRQTRWEDPTAGLNSDRDERTDAALVWLPLPMPERFDWVDVATEPRLIAMPSRHPLAKRERIQFTDLLDVPFLALPARAGALRDFWLALDARNGRAPVIGGVIASTEETVESLTAGLGVCLIAAGNAPLIARDGVIVRPVDGVSPSRLVLAWRRNDDRPLIRTLRAAVLAARG